MGLDSFKSDDSSSGENSNNTSSSTKVELPDPAVGHYVDNIDEYVE